MLPIPSLKEALRFIQTDASRAALRTVTPIRLIGPDDQDQDTLIIGANTPISTTVRRKANGPLIISPVKYANFPVGRTTHGPRSVFHILTDHITETARRVMLTELKAWLAPSPDPEDPDTLDRDQAVLDILRSRKVHTALIQEARRVASLHPDLQGPDAPLERAHQALEEFIGIDLLNRYKALAGRTVTLHHIHIMQFHLKEFEEVAERFPNDVILWSRTSGDIPQHTNVPAMSATAKAVDQLLRNPWGFLPQNWGDTLEAFHGLDTQAVRDFPDLTLNDYSRLTSAISLAGCQPSPEATRHLLANPATLQPTPRRLITAFIAESNRLQQAEPGPEAQLRLTTQMDALQRYARPHYAKRRPEHRWDSQPLQRATISWVPTHPPTWADLLELAPPWVKDLRHPDDLKSHKEKFPTPRTHPLSRTETQETLTSYPWPQLAALATSRALTVQTGPGPKASITSWDNNRPILSAERLSDGRITLTSKHGPMPHLNVPNPRSTASYTELYSYNEIRDTTYRAIETALSDTLHRHWPTIAPSPFHKPPKGQKLKDLIYNNTLRTGHPTISTPAVENLHPAHQCSHALARALLDLIDNDAWDTATRLTGEHRSQAPLVQVRQYNNAVTLAPHLPDLERTNPGAVALGFRYLRSGEHLTHPGQFISAVRSLMEENGMDPRSWRTATTLDHDTVLAITDTCYLPEQAARAIDLIQEAQAKPAPAVAGFLAGAAPQNLTDPTAAIPNLRTIARLLCRESQRLLQLNPADRHQRYLLLAAQDVLDYTINVTAQATLLRNTTWASLLRRADEWHEGLRREGGRASLRRLLQKRRRSGEPPVSWRSLVPETQVNNCTAVPLTDEDQLIQESIDMGNCVYQYTKRCLGGTRLFSIQKDNHKVATSAIANHKGLWQPIETRGPDNSTDLTEEIIQTVAHIAMLYTQAWLESLQEQEGSPAP